MKSRDVNMSGVDKRTEGEGSEKVGSWRSKETKRKGERKRVMELECGSQ